MRRCMVTRFFTFLVTFSWCSVSGYHDGATVGTGCFFLFLTAFWAMVTTHWHFQAADWILNDMANGEAHGNTWPGLISSFISTLFTAGGTVYLFGRNLVWKEDFKIFKEELKDVIKDFKEETSDARQQIREVKAEIKADIKDLKRHSRAKKRKQTDQR